MSAQTSSAQTINTDRYVNQLKQLKVKDFLRSESDTV